MLHRTTRARRRSPSCPTSATSVGTTGRRPRPSPARVRIDNRWQAPVARPDDDSDWRPRAGVKDDAGGSHPLRRRERSRACSSTRPPRHTSAAERVDVHADVGIGAERSPVGAAATPRGRAPRRRQGHRRRPATDKTAALQRSGRVSPMTASTAESSLRAPEVTSQCLRHDEQAGHAGECGGRSTRRRVAAPWRSATSSTAGCR
jgi:hypothetical protein